MKKVLGCLSMAALAVVLAPPVSAQITLKASVPFDFVVGGHTMPAGDYVVRTVTTATYLGVLEVRNLSSDTRPIFTTSNPAGRPKDPGQALLTFHRYGGDYFLAKVCDGYTEGRSIQMSRTEQERANRASLSKPEVVMVLARR